MDVSYTFHLAGEHHREVAERLADLIFGSRNRVYKLRCSLEEAGKSYQSHTAPVRPMVIHSDKEMDSTITIFAETGELERLVRLSCDEHPDTSAIWWEIEDVNDTEYNLHCWFYTSVQARTSTTSSIIRCMPDLFDESLHLHLNEMLAKVTGAYQARFDVNRNIVLLSNPPVEIPQCEWVDPRINPVFRDIVNNFIPQKKQA